MRFTMTVDLDNAAFQDNPDELKDILYRVGGGIVGPIASPARGTLRDSNGATVGSWEVTED